MYSPLAPPNAGNAQYSPEYLSEYSGDKVILVSAIFIALETIFVPLRFYARTLTTSARGWDDIIIPAAWLANIGMCILGIGQYRSTSSTDYSLNFSSHSSCYRYWSSSSRGAERP